MVSRTRCSSRRRQNPAELRFIAKAASDVSYSILPRVKESSSIITDFRFFLDRNGIQHFNFTQRVWLNASIQMGFTPVPTTALETLALNILTMVTRERDVRTAIGTTSRRALVLMSYFCAECLLGAPVEAWELPRASIKAWIESHRALAMHRSAKRPEATRHHESDVMRARVPARGPK
jgi:hypothetical protein